MGRYWRNFAWTGDPNEEGASGRSPNSTSALPAWPRFAADGTAAQPAQEQTMVLDVGSLAPAPALKRAQCDAFRQAS